MKTQFQIEYNTNWGQELKLHIDGQDYPMDNDGNGHWFTILNRNIPEGAEYRYMVYENGVCTRPEERHHIFHTPSDSTVIYDRWAVSGADAISQRPVTIPFVNTQSGKFWHGAGTAVPVFSLRSERGMGIGEFTDLKLLADWAEKTHQSIIQILPVNDTTITRTWKDSYPYNSNSAFALNPIYLNLEELGLMSASDLRSYRRTCYLLNKEDGVNYEKVLRAKRHWLRIFYFKDGERCMQTPEFQEFLQREGYWLRSYAVWCYYRDRFRTADCSQWGATNRNYSQQKVDKICSPESSTYIKVSYYMYIQFHLDRQLRQAKEYLNSRGILLKGDIPIGIGRHSVDAWMDPDLFNMDCQAGAPPDDFARDGQRWGFPTYNWQKMAQTGYRWFIDRFRHMARHFDAYRIDHLLGFFRIWEIPLKYNSGLMGHFNPSMPMSPEEIRSMGFSFDHNAHAVSTDPADQTQVLFIEDEKQKGYYHPRITGYETTVFESLEQTDKDAFMRIHEEFYYRRHEQFWKDSAMQKLPALVTASDMVVCAEDLGMIPQCVPGVMDDLRMLGLEIQRMPKAFGVQVGDPATYPYMSVCTASSHDMSGIRCWLEQESPVMADGKRPEATPKRCRRLLLEHLASPSMLAIFPIQDWLATDGKLRHPRPEEERINVPADPDNYWHYRMHLTLEQLLTEEEFNASVRRMIEECGR